MSENDKDILFWKPVLVGSLAVVGIWSVTFILFAKWDLQDLGLTGDTFGIVNSLFSGLAFVGVAYAIYAQRVEIRIAKEDLRKTQKILEFPSVSPLSGASP